jgi:serine/threonine protein kinase
MNLCHLDIKLDNILVNMNYQLCLCDFGFARPHDSLIKGGFGSYGYMAPEIHVPNASYKGVCADIFSLGVLLFIMAFGRPFFKNEEQPLNIGYNIFMTKTTSIYF